MIHFSLILLPIPLVQVKDYEHEVSDADVEDPQSQISPVTFDVSNLIFQYHSQSQWHSELM